MKNKEFISFIIFLFLVSCISNTKKNNFKKIRKEVKEQDIFKPNAVIYHKMTDTVSYFDYKGNRVGMIKNDEKMENFITLKINRKISCYDSISSFKGVLVINSDSLKDNSEIKILNKDASLYKKIKFNEEYIISSFYCYGIKNNLYMIKIDNKKKFISSNNLSSFKTWNDFLLNDIFSINFNTNENPIRDKKTNKIILNQKSNNYKITVLKINGYLMKIKYTDYNKEKSIEGWIKWRDENCLLIEIFHFA